MTPVLRESKKIREYSARSIHDSHRYPFGLRTFWGPTADKPRREGELARQTKHASAAARQAAVNEADQDSQIGVIDPYARHDGEDE